MIKQHKVVSKLGAVALAAILISSATGFSPSAQAVITSLVGAPVFSGVGSGAYYDSVGGFMFTVPADYAPGFVPQVTSLGRFYFGAGTYNGALNTSTVNGWTSPPLQYTTSAGNAGLRTISLIKVINLDLTTSNLFATASNGKLIAKVSLDPATTPIDPATSQAIPGSDATGGWQYAALTTPVILEKGATYVLEGTNLGWFSSPINARSDGQVFAQFGEVKTPIASGLTFMGNVYAYPGTNWDGTVGNDVNGFAWFNYLNGSGNWQTGPANLQFELITPEPSSVMLLGLGGLLIWRRWRAAR